MRTPLIHRLLAAPMAGREIEAKSFATIDAEVPAHDFTPEQWQVVRRVIHTVGDPEIRHQVRFSPDAIQAAVAALRDGSPLYVDAQMIRAGLSLARLRQACPDYSPDHIHCHVSDPEIAAQAGAAGLPRSLFAVRKARKVLEGGIAVFGNAPTALLELNRLIVEEDARPALVIGMPVGFVHVVESKEELMSLDVPYVVLEGRRGGSPLAVSAVHALCTVAGALPKRISEKGGD
jgi:precorrin-8X/cobalt-precorrin-8 methylmutase